MGFKLNKAKDVDAEVDTLGSGGAIDSGLYPLTITNAYKYESDKGSQALVLEVKTDEGKTMRQMHFVTTQKGDIFYEKQDGSKKYLQGYLIANALAMIMSEGEAGIGDLETEDKIISVYDHDTGGDVNKKVPVFTDLVGFEFVGGILKVSKPKSVKQSDGTYKDSPTETIEVNELDKVFSAEGFTLIEMEEGAEEPVFQEKWSQRWEGKVKTIKPKVEAASRGARGNANVRTGARTAASKPAAGAKKSFFKK